MIDVQILLPRLSGVSVWFVQHFELAAHARELLRAARRSGDASSSSARRSSILGQPLVDALCWLASTCLRSASIRARASSSSNRPARAAAARRRRHSSRRRRAAHHRVPRISTRRRRACRCAGSATRPSSWPSVQRGFSSPRLTDSIWLFLRAHQQQHFLHAVGALLPQGDVVLAAAALVAVALDQHLRRRIVAQVARVRLRPAACIRP